MIVLNEEKTLGRVLGDVVDLCDEIVVVDTGSTDGTLEVAGNFGARILSFDWVDDFAAARNYSLSHCRGEWVLWLDADDRVPEIAQNGIRQILDEVAEQSAIDGVVLPYRTEYTSDNPDLCLHSVNRERLISQWNWALLARDNPRNCSDT